MAPISISEQIVMQNFYERSNYITNNALVAFYAVIVFRTIEFIFCMTYRRKYLNLKLYFYCYA